ncbi:hypothetical protein [Glycomyces salinus]|uniref:hypothetical protein n=1 Tax=Glycomyces salinus TaxID=980294 RepID=UPI0018ECC5B2|nr:hypothetical protein [Glycomyces salinus]
MTMWKRITAALAGILIAVGAAQTVAVEDASAFEFGPGSYLVQGVVDLEDCDLRFGGLDYDDRGSYCYEYDTADSTYFYKENGKRGYKVELYSEGDLGAKFECHPSRNQIMVYDTLNDGDGIYWEVFTSNGPLFLKAPGTSKKVEYNTYSVSGNVTRVTVWDNANRTDQITSMSWHAGPLCKL